LSNLRRPASLALACLLVFSTGCGDDGDATAGTPPVAAFDSEVALRWFDLSLDLVRETGGFSPPVASRAFGYLGVALYEAIVPGMPDHQSLAGQVADFPVLPAPAPDARLHWPAVANAALASLMRELFPGASEENLAAIDALEQEILDEESSSAEPETLLLSQEHGQNVAAAVFEWSRSDGGHEGYLRNFPTDYVPPEGPGLWVQTPPQFLRALQPYWGSNRTFVDGTVDACHPEAPPAYSEQEDSAFFAEAMEAYDAVNNLTDEQRDIAFFWSDDAGQTATPPGHSISILSQILAMENARLDVAAEAYARVGMAVADAFIACWYTKFVYNLLRPVTYIQALIDPDWQPLLVTPPFPEYGSGHSVQSAAAALVMTDLFGHLAFVDHTHDDRGLEARSFESFIAAADEAAISRLYGGIHYRAAIDRGIDQGACVGSRISALRLRRD
jgi:hypothetical protein